MKVYRDRSVRNARRIGAKGFAILPVLFLMALLAATSVYLLNHLSEKQAAMDEDRVLLGRTIIELELRHRAAFAPNLFATAVVAGDATLKRCLFDDFDLTNDCDVNLTTCAGRETVDGTIWCPLSLVDATTKEKIAGTVGDPTLYADTGQLCSSAGSASCTYKATASFRPICSSGASACKQANSIIFRFVVSARNRAQIAPLQFTQTVIVNDGSNLSIVKAAETPAPVQAPSQIPAGVLASQPAGAQATFAANDVSSQKSRSSAATSTKAVAQPSPTPKPKLPRPPRTRGCAAGTSVQSKKCKAFTI